MEKRDNKISMQSPGSQYFPMTGKLLSRATNGSMGGLVSRYRALLQEKKGVAYVESKNPDSNQECRPTLCQCNS